MTELMKGTELNPVVQCYEIAPAIGGGICPRCGIRTEWNDEEEWRCANCRLVCDPYCLAGKREHKHATKGWTPR